MSNPIGISTDISKAVVELPAIDSLSTAIRGEVITPDSPGYDEARSLWNSMIDRKPALVVRCTSAEDVRQAVLFAKRYALLVAVKGGGHNIAGNACCDNGLMIDLSGMKAIDIETSTRLVTAGPGVTLGELDAATQEHGLAVPVGINSTTGLAGLTLGGGFGWLSRRYGLTIDNLVSAKVVTANGDIVTASETEHSDLFWGIRGGGGNFGVVTSFTFRAHPVGPMILAGLVAHPFERARDLMRFYRDFVDTLPEDVTVWCVMRKAPPAPFIPEEVHGKEVFIFVCVCSGDPERGAEALRPLREYLSPALDTVGMVPYVAMQQAFDPLMSKGFRNYWKTHDFLELKDEVIEAMIDGTWSLPGPHCEAFIGNLGGAVRRVSADATAYRDRDVKFVLNIHARWETPEEDDACIRWARGMFERMKPFATGEAYVNFMSGDESERVRSAYGANYDRLVELKRRYDPTNLFRMNQNIKPGSVDAVVI